MSTLDDQDLRAIGAACRFAARGELDLDPDRVREMLLTVVDQLQEARADLRDATQSELPGPVPEHWHLLAQIEELTADNERLLTRCAELRRRRIHVRPSGTQGGSCLMRCGGAYTLRSDATHLEVRSDDVVIRIDHVPVDQCERCGHTLYRAGDAARLNELLADAELPETAITPAAIVRLDWHHDTGHPSEAD